LNHWKTQATHFSLSHSSYKTRQPSLKTCSRNSCFNCRVNSWSCASRRNTSSYW